MALIFTSDHNYKQIIQKSLTVKPEFTQEFSSEQLSRRYLLNCVVFHKSVDYRSHNKGDKCMKSTSQTHPGTIQI